jgi:hypothetical protein
MKYVYIVFGTYDDCDDQDLLGVFTTYEAAEVRAIAARADNSLRGVDFAYIYKATLDVNIDLW